MTEKQVEKWIRDYHWMMNTVKMLYEGLEDAGGGGVAQYGDEAGMPKAQGLTGDVVLSEVIRRGKHWERIAEYEKKIHFIQKNIHVITEERETEILHWLLEGKSYAWISRHMGLSQTHTKRICSSIAEQIVRNVRNGRCG
ncbi:hypothetical protein HMPREF9372_3372 [Sporosarcina newyorkensis 2681]|uniref:HTH luxR-type domain-containing protein n=1 Tax=Sporosarcina newyorkensis 2681 TaxID=1027292 RepID=F9DX41_9BACL|nr:hypothetical protein [Sporosarcina newyorkensis]EGQ21089.1 hypothetical protein HMPREF9372_3372 [Sporosarcina newyorkensis 2681]